MSRHHAAPTLRASYTLLPRLQVQVLRPHGLLPWLLSVDATRHHLNYYSLQNHGLGIQRRLDSDLQQRKSFNLCQLSQSLYRTPQTMYAVFGHGFRNSQRVTFLQTPATITGSLLDNISGRFVHVRVVSWRSNEFVLSILTPCIATDNCAVLSVETLKGSMWRSTWVLPNRIDLERRRLEKELAADAGLVLLIFVLLLLTGFASKSTLPLVIISLRVQALRGISNRYLFR